MYSIPTCTSWRIALLLVVLLSVLLAPQSASAAAPTCDALTSQTAPRGGFTDSLHLNCDPRGGGTLSVAVLTPPAHGTAQPNTTPGGQPSYTPPLNYTGMDPFTLRVSTAAAGEYVDVPVPMRVIANPFSCDAATVTTRPSQHATVRTRCQHESIGPFVDRSLSLISSSDPSVATFQFGFNGDVYVKGQAPGTSTVVLKMTDMVDPIGANLTLQITVDPVHNTAPNCTMTSTQSIRVGMSMDITPRCVDADGDALSYLTVSAEHGTTSGFAANSVFGSVVIPYTAPAAPALETISFTVTDRLSAPVLGQIVFAVVGPATNHAPDCTPLTASTVYSGTAAIPLLMPCSDPERDALTYRIAENPTKGVAATANGGTIVTYRATANVAARDSFWVVASDGTEDSPAFPVTVDTLAGPSGDLDCLPVPTLTVRPATNRNAPLYCSAPGESVSYSIVGPPNPQVATAAMSFGGTLVRGMAAGTTTLTVRATATISGAHTDVPIAVEVSPGANETPACYIGALGEQLSVRPGVPGTLRVECTDPDGDAVVATASTTLPGVVQLTAGQRGPKALTFTPAADALAQTGAILISAVDGHGGETTASAIAIIVDGTGNHAPTCTLFPSDAAHVVTHGGVQTVRFLPNVCSDADGDPMRLEVVAHPTHAAQIGASELFTAEQNTSGSHSCSPACSFYEYTPLSSYAGADELRVRACDDRGACSAVYARPITVHRDELSCPASMDPVTMRTGAKVRYVYVECTGGTWNRSFELDRAVPFDEHVVSADVDESGEITLHPVGVGSTTVTLLAHDSEAEHPARTSISVTVSTTSNAAPECSWSYFPAPAVRASSARQLTAYCSDDDGDALTAHTTRNPQHGTTTPLTFHASPDSPGFYEAVRTYTAGATIGADSMSTIVSDGHGGSTTFTQAVSIVAASTNSAPVCESNDASGRDMTLVGDTDDQEIFAGCSDADEDALTLRVLRAPEHGTVATTTTGTLTYTPAPGFRGTDSIAVTANDGFTDSVTIGVRTFDVIDPAPDTFISSGPIGTTSSTVATFTYRATGVGTTFQCRLDLGIWASCPNVDTRSGLAQGVHTLRVRSVNAQGTADPDPALRTWTIDAAAPEATTMRLAAGAELASPLGVSVTVPTSGSVRVEGRDAPATTPPANYALLGRELRITAPAASSGTPLRMVFTLDTSAIPAGTDTTKVHVIRDGAPVTAACAGETAVPSPCERSRNVAPSGSISITVLTTHASTWVFGAVSSAAATPGGTTGTGDGNTPPPPAPPTPAATKLTGVSARVLKQRCTKARGGSGVTVRGVKWCFSLVLSAKLVTASGAPVAKQPIRFAREVRRTSSPVRSATTNAAGIARATLPIVVPRSARASIAKANQWISGQYGAITATHLVSGTSVVAAPVVRVKVKR